MITREAEIIIRNLDGVNFEDKKILITGGGGFIGSTICDVLINQNAKVICIDNFTSGKKENIEHLLEYEHFSLIEHDIADPISIDDPIDYIMHLASRASPFEFEIFPIQIMKSNTIGLWNALGVAKKHGARLLFASTSEIYGDARILPTPETYWGNVNTIGPRGCYDEAKRAGEAFCMAYNRQHDLDVRIARIFNTYGPRMRSDGLYGRVVPRFIEQAIANQPITIFGDGSQTRSFCYISDQVEGLLRLLFMDDLKGEVVNIGNPREITILTLGEIIKKMVNSQSVFVTSPLPPDDPKRRCPDIRKANDLLKWNPKISLHEGLKRMIEYFKDQNRGAVVLS